MGNISMCIFSDILMKGHGLFPEYLKKSKIGTTLKTTNKQHGQLTTARTVTNNNDINPQQQQQHQQPTITTVSDNSKNSRQKQQQQHIYNRL